MTASPTAATRRFAGAAAATGVLAAVALPGNRAGLGLLLVALASAACIVFLVPRPAPYGLTLWALAGALAATAVLRDADWLVATNLSAAAGCASLAASRQRSARGVLNGALGVVRRMPAGALFAAWCTGLRPRHTWVPTLMPAARGAALGGGLALAFGGLFASADPAFAHFAGQALNPELDLGLLPARLALFAGLVASTGAVAVVALAGPDDARPATPRRDRHREWIAALGIVDLVFAFFVAVQLAVLFGGHDHVLKTEGLTYAEYAREGFGQLLLVAVLTLAVIGRAARHRKAEARFGPLELLTGALCLLTLVVLVSALRRLGLYEDAYGFTVLRLLGQATTLWVGVVLLLFVIAGLRGRSEWLPRALAGVTGAALVVLALLNPEGLVADRNVDRFRNSGRIDLDYLSGLSADAAPAIAQLGGERAACALTDVARDLRAGDGVFELNIGRARARRTVRSLSSGACR